MFNELITWTYGLVVIIAFVSYLVVFNMVWDKLTGENSESDNVFRYIFFPLIFPVALILILAIPYYIGKEALGLG